MDLTRLDQLLADWTDPEGRRLQVDPLAEDSAGVVLAVPGAWERYRELVAWRGRTAQECPRQ